MAGSWRCHDALGAGRDGGMRRHVCVVVESVGPGMQGMRETFLLCTEGSVGIWLWVRIGTQNWLALVNGNMD